METILAGASNPAIDWVISEYVCAIGYLILSVATFSHVAALFILFELIDVFTSFGRNLHACVVVPMDGHGMIRFKVYSVCPVSAARQGESPLGAVADTINL